MGIHLWLVVALASFDLLLLALAYFQMRACPPINQAALIATGAGLAGFVFHAFLFFDGAFLILQLATISGVFGICWLQHLGRLSKPKEKVAE
jgi:hypothetical protein